MPNVNYETESLFYVQKSPSSILAINNYTVIKSFSIKQRKLIVRAVLSSTIKKVNSVCTLSVIKVTSNIPLPCFDFLRLPFGMFTKVYKYCCNFLENIFELF